MQKKLLVVATMLALVFIVPQVALAHVTVSPKEVGVGKFQTFNLSVPVEREVATTAVRLVIPEGLEHVSPTVKPGWKIDVKHGAPPEGQPAGEHSEHGPVIELSWTGGSIPQGQRDDFTFSAKVPAKATTLSWKAYQTYADGTVVAWELGPNDQQPQKDGKPDFSSKGPASETKIIDDLATPPPAQPISQSKTSGGSNNVTFAVSLVALVLSGLALMRTRTKPGVNE
jgi:uncharacterized protein YcnI